MILEVANTGSFNYIIFAIIIVLMIISMLVVYSLYMQNKQLIDELKKKNNEINEDNFKELVKEDKQVVPDFYKPSEENIEKSNQEMVDLQSITKDLESKQNEKNIDFTPYEEEQEKMLVLIILKKKILMMF